MSKYAPLTKFLQIQDKASLPCSFGELEKVLGFDLPPVAREYRAWWSNNPKNNVMTKAWLNAGFKTEQVDMKGERLVFRRERGEEERAGLRSTTAAVVEHAGNDNALLKEVLEVLVNDPVRAESLRTAIRDALSNSKPKTALDVFGSDLSDDAFAGVFPEKRVSDWREVDL